MIRVLKGSSGIDEPGAGSQSFDLLDEMGRQLHSHCVALFQRTQRHRAGVQQLPTLFQVFDSMGSSGRGGCEVAVGLDEAHAIAPALRPCFVPFLEGGHGFAQRLGVSVIRIRAEACLLQTDG